jgi:hypothetical protein
VPSKTFSAGPVINILSPSTRARATRQSLANTSFPYTNVHFATVYDLDEFNIHSIWEEIAMFYLGADPLYGKLVDRIDKDNAVRIPYRKASSPKVVFIYREWFINAFSFPTHGNFFSLEDGFSHVRAYTRNLPVYHGKPHAFQSRKRFNNKFLLLDNSFVVAVFRQATNTVTTHFGFTTI